jgi:hypothetical protein
LSTVVMQVPPDHALSIITLYQDALKSKEGVGSLPQLLLQRAGGNPAAAAALGRLVMFYAAVSESAVTVTSMLSVLGDDLVDEIGRATALSVAVMVASRREGTQQLQPRIDTVTVLLENQPSHGEFSDLCPLQVAADHSGVSVAQVLVQAGVCRTSNHCWQNALETACQRGHVPMVQLLLKNQHNSMTAAQVQLVLSRITSQAALHGWFNRQPPSFPAIAQLLLHMQKRGSSAAAFVAGNAFLKRAKNRAPLRLALLKGWASSSSRELDEAVAQQVALTARGVEMRDMLVAVACAGRAAADPRMEKVQGGSNGGLTWWGSCKQWAASLFVLS